jgi:anaerobic dimethyl sulfoxide reductase subunit B
MKQPAFHMDQTKCVGCKACEIACKDRNDLASGIRWRRVAEYGGGRIERRGGVFRSTVFTYYVSLACNHCEHPECVKGCPTGALRKGDDGVVLVDQDVCVGCEYCSWRCPYGAPRYDARSGVMTKCTFCHDWLEQDLQPACVAACPQRALDCGDLDDLRAKYGDVDAVAPLPSAGLTTPSIVLTPHPLAQAPDSAAGYILNPEEM